MPTGSTATTESRLLHRQGRSADGGHQLLKVEEAAEFLRISRNACYELVRQGQIPNLKLGRIIRIPRFALESWLGNQVGLPFPATPDPVATVQRH